VEIVRGTIEDLLGPHGPVASHLGEGFEPRPQQIAMSRAVEDVMRAGGAEGGGGGSRVLMVEAGTGVGKSFAYLVPAVREILRTGKRVVVATNTIALQEQLVHKDIPVLEKVFTDEKGEPAFRAELVKGRGNYLSMRRLAMASQRQDRLFPDMPAKRSLHVIEDWAYGTADGSLSTLPPLERPGVWDRVQSDSGNCMGRKCPTYEKCFYQTARRRMERAELLICNHALYFSDLALKTRGIGFLPEYAHVILDEAHMVEEVAADHFGVSLAEGRVNHMLSMLVSTRGDKGFLATMTVPADAQATLDRVRILVERAREVSETFFGRLSDLTDRRAGQVRLPGGEETENPITPVFREMGLGLKRLREAVVVEEDRFELNGYSERAEMIADDAAMLCERSLPGFAYWVEVGASDYASMRVKMACSPIEVGPLLEKYLFDRAKGAVVLTSATMTVGGEKASGTRHQAPEGREGEEGSEEEQGVRGGFGHIKRQLGCAGAKTLVLGSPFLHGEQVEFIVDGAMPDPRAHNFMEELSRRIVHHVRATEGGAFVLFTSFAMLSAAAKATRMDLEDRGYPVFVHGDGEPRSVILEKFRDAENGVLFGTTSFWQGVDVRGRALRNVIITRLPFDPPDRPLTQARNEVIEARGGNAFMEDSLPRAVIRFKQGFGRLIRSSTDSGRVVVLDPRIVRARYGRMFLAALPEGVRVMGGEVDSDE